MKIAYTINGLIGGLSGKNCQLRDQDIAPLIINYTSNTVKNFIEKHNDVDFYIFSWQPELKEYFNSIYRPKQSVYINQLEFKIPSCIPNDERTQAHYSRWYGVKRLSEMIYNSAIPYDLVINCRMDTCWNRDIHFTDFDTNKIHVAYHPTMLNFLPFNKNAVDICDHIFISNTENFHKFASLFDNLDDYVHPSKHKCSYSHISNHFLVPQHLRSLNLIDRLEGSIVNDLEAGKGTGDYDIFRYKQLTKHQLLENYEL
jgi:hypothetical protein